MPPLSSSRHGRHAALSRRLAGLSDRDVLDRLHAVEPTRGFGGHRTITVDDAPVFVKTLPLTALERAHPGSTKNRFGLPPFYSYGLGSAGFGAFRELAAHVKTTRWVLDGLIDTFPLMYHHRILAMPSDVAPMDAEALDRYVASWDGSDAVREFILARQDADHAVVLFLEFVPHALRDWLIDHQARLPRVLAAMERTLRFLRERDVVHFDAHLGNVLTDGDGVFLTDFGLLLDAEFDLTPEEEAFRRAHRHYDVGEFITTVYRPFYAMVRAWDEPTKATLRARYGDLETATLVQKLEDLSADGHLVVSPDYLRVLVQYRHVMSMMDGVFAALTHGPKAAQAYNDAALVRVLERARRAR